MGIGCVLERNFGVPYLRLSKSLFRGFAELDHIRVVADKDELVALQDNSSSRAGDLETIGARSLASGRDEHTGGAVVKFQIRGYIVLDFNPMETAKLAEAANTRWHP